MAYCFQSFAVSKGATPALIDEFGETSWHHFNHRVNQLMHAFRRRDLQVGTILAVLAGNRREYVETVVAAAHSGFLTVPVNWHFVAEEVCYLIEDSGAEVLVADNRFADVAIEVANRVTGLKLKTMMGNEVPSGFIAYEDLLASESTDEPDEQAMGLMMSYTAGTTGRPKGVKGSAHAAIGGDVSRWQQGAQRYRALLSMPLEGRTLLCSPLYHAAQVTFSVVPFFCGSSIVMRHRFDPAETLDLIDRYRITNVHLVPTQFVRLLQYHETHQDETSVPFQGDSLQVVWHSGAPCSPDIKRRMIEWWGPKFIEGYGSTEGNWVSLISSPEWLARPTSVGKPVESVEVQIVREDGSQCAVGESGQICVRNRNGADFEYHNHPEETAARHLAPGVFASGDIGYLDADGYLHLTGRQIDLIISGGVNIAPAEIEGVLVAHPAVNDVTVFGIPNAEYGEEIKAAVELVDHAMDHQALEHDLRRYCEAHLARYKIPRSFDFVDTLPRTPTGKLYKHQLRDPYWVGQSGNM